ncbi:MAG: hypothetical protein AAF462_05475 [Thermodesulfobacteriota bacterium]
MDKNSVLENIKDHFTNCGFNLVRAIDPAKYNEAVDQEGCVDNFLPNTKSIILVGFAGKSFWAIFNDYLEKNPAFKEKNTDLIDQYTVLQFKRARQILDENNMAFKEFYPFGENALSLNFLKLAELGGAGVKSLLGIFLNPRYGSWMSLRGALITDIEPKEYDSPLQGFNPCPTCDKPCISACPIHVISESGWDWHSCMQYRISDSTCKSFCASRLACPYGEDERYTMEQIQYHQEFVLKSAKKYFKNNP